MELKKTVHLQPISTQGDRLLFSVVDDSESCLSGRKSRTRNAVYALCRTGGSNPSLSAKPNKWLKHRPTLIQRVLLFSIIRYNS